MSNPLDPRCQAFAQSDGKITGVKLSHLPVPTNKYELVTATLIDEVAAQGQTIASVHVVDKDGLPVRLNYCLAWLWEGWTFPNRFENHLLPGNPTFPTST